MSSALGVGLLSPVVGTLLPTSRWLCPQCLGATAALPPSVSGVELDSLISQVKDLLPDLGEGFILACLEHYCYDPEQVINNILEERLAPALSQLDRSLDRWERQVGGVWRPACFGAPSRALSGPCSFPCLPLSLLVSQTRCSHFPHHVSQPSTLEKACLHRRFSHAPYRAECPAGLACGRQLITQKQGRGVKGVSEPFHALESLPPSLPGPHKGGRLESLLPPAS